MTDTQDIRSRLIEIVEPVCEDAGYELVDLRYQRDKSGWVVRVFIDQLASPQAGDGDSGEERISFADCERVSRELSAVLDVEDPVPAAYNLEVSSPGVERPLRRPEHFRRFAGQEAKLALGEGVDGRRNFRGTLMGFDDDSSAILMKVEGHQLSLPLSDLRSAKLIVDWDQVLKESAARHKEQPGR